MAYLNLNTLEAVNFAGRECMPEINAELKLRLANIKNYDEESCAVLASAFPKDEGFVRDFLKKMTTVDIEILHAYLMGGATMVESIRKQLDGALGEARG